MAMSRAEAYKNRRVYAAVRGGFNRLGINGSARERERLKKGLSLMWDKKIGTLCPLECGQKLTPRRSAFCHNVALSAGGSHTVSNIYLACGRCNKSQRTLCMDEYLKLRHLIIQHFGEERWKKIRGWLAGAKH